MEDLGIFDGSTLRTTHHISLRSNSARYRKRGSRFLFRKKFHFREQAEVFTPFFVAEAPEGPRPENMDCRVPAAPPGC